MMRPSISSLGEAALAAFVLLLLIVAVRVRPRRKDAVSKTIFWQRFLNEGRVEKFTKFMLGDVASTDAAAWKAIGGLAGVLRMLWQSMPLLGILQAHVGADPTLEPAAAELRKKAFFQLRCSVFAIPEALTASVFKLPHLYGRMAAQAHIEITMRVQNLCFSEDTPECVGNLY